MYFFIGKSLLKRVHRFCWLWWLIRHPCFRVPGKPTATHFTYRLCETPQRFRSAVFLELKSQKIVRLPPRIQQCHWEQPTPPLTHRLIRQSSNCATLPDLRFDRWSGVTNLCGHHPPAFKSFPSSCQSSHARSCR